MLKKRCEVTEVTEEDAFLNLASVTSHRSFNMDQIAAPHSIPPNLNNLPQEVAEHVVEVIRSWTNVEEKFQARRWVLPFSLLLEWNPLFWLTMVLPLLYLLFNRSRDSALLALSMTSRLGYRAFYSCLLRSITLKPCHITAFSQVLERDLEAGEQIQHLIFSLSGIASENQVSIPLSLNSTHWSLRLLSSIALTRKCLV